MEEQEDETHEAHRYDVELALGQCRRAATWTDFFNRIEEGTPDAEDVLEAARFWEYWPLFFRLCARDDRLHHIAEKIICVAAEDRDLDCSCIRVSGDICRDLIAKDPACTMGYLSWCKFVKRIPRLGLWSFDPISRTQDTLDSLKRMLEGEQQQRSAKTETEDTPARVEAQDNAERTRDATRQTEPSGQWLTAKAIAARYGFKKGLTEQRLKRFWVKKGNSECRRALPNTSVREARYVYNIDRVRPVIEALQAKYSRNHG